MNFGIIAAGEGSRLATEGVAVPKPLVPLDGRPMIGRLIDIFLSLGAERIAVVVNPAMPEVAEYLRGRASECEIPFEIVVRSTPSSMHTYDVLSSVLSPYGRFITTTVDTVFRPDEFAGYVRAFEEAPEEVAGMMAVTSYIDDEKPLYVSTDEEMLITGFHDTAVPGARFISAGIYGLDARALPVMRECLEAGKARMRNFQRALVDAGLDLRAYDLGKVIDVDHASDIATAREVLGLGR